MRIFLRKIVAKVVSKEMKSNLKSFEYKNRKRLVDKLPALSKEQLIDILVNKLEIKEGDNLFIHASLDMVNSTLTPLEMVKTILDIVGEEGSLSVPTFIRYSSKEWMEMDKAFHITRTPSGMGIFSERVRRYKGANRSLHPTKSVATIGKIGATVLSEHHLDIYQFGTKSPFYKLLDYDVKVVGLGAPMSYLSMVHLVEDVHPNEYPLQVNEEKIYEKPCVDKDKNSIDVKSVVHDLKVVVKANPEKFVTQYMNKDNYKIHKHYMTPFFMVEGKALFESLRKEMHAGNTIYD
jgi:aminoglycoside 3-N-acetyltransferase